MSEIRANEWFNREEVAVYYDGVAKDSSMDSPRVEIGKTKLDLRCGPVLRLLGTLEKACSYRASMLLVTSSEFLGYSGEMPTVEYQLGPANGEEEMVKVAKGRFPGELIHQEDTFLFWRFAINLNLSKIQELKCRYFINSEYKPGYEFYLPRLNQSMNCMFYSCNGFSYKSDTSSYRGSLWTDVLRNHLGPLHYHVMIGGGDQIYADVIKRDAQPLVEWLAAEDANERVSVENKTDFKQDLNRFYLRHYLKWYGSGYMDGTVNKTFIRTFPKALATIPSVNIYDDHDIIDGFGSYKDHINATQMFLGIGEAAFKYYLLFQHHTSMAEKATTLYHEPSWILGAQPGPYIKEKSMSIWTRLGQSMALLSVDCRTERTLHQIVTTETYNIIFNRLEKELESSGIKHLLVLLGVPIFYPRLVLLEALLNNSVTKTLSSSLRKLNIGSGAIQEFDGSVDIVDDLNDHWCSGNHKPERNQFVARLQRVAAKYNARITILGGDVHLAAVGRLRSVKNPEDTSLTHHHHFTHHHHRHSPEVNPQLDPRLMFNIVSSAIVNHPPPDKVGKLLFNCQKKHVFGKEAEEDMVPVFKLEPDGVTKRFQHHTSEFLNKRNYADLIPVDNVSHYSTQLGKIKFPGPVDKSNRQSLVSEPLTAPIDTDEKSRKYHYDLGYPVDPQGLAVTLHVEKDITDVEAKTFDYELMVPSLNCNIQEPLPQTNVKYVD